MGSEHLLGIDLGTSGCKAVITDLNGEIIAEHFLEHEVISPRPGWFEQDPEKDWWNNLVAVIKVLLKKSGIDPKGISGIGLTGMYMCTVILDRKGTPIRPAILHHDNRRREVIRSLITKFGFAKGDQLANLLWLKENEPKNFEKIKIAIGSHNYLVYKLTGKYSIDYNIAQSYGCFNTEQKKWDEELLANLGVSPDILPPVYPSYGIVGGVTEDAARTTGLESGTPVIAGSGDTPLSVLSCGVIGRGDAMIKYGSIASFMICLDDGASVSSLLHCVELPSKLRWLSRHTLERLPRPFGALIKWFKDEFGSLEKEAEQTLGIDTYELLDKEAEQIPPGADGLIVLPHFFGSRGIIYGLNLYHTRAHLYRALLESCGYSLRHDLELFKKQAKSQFITPRRIIAIDGGAKSHLWRQIVSDILNLSQEYVNNPGSCYGAAYLAGYGVGIFRDFNFMKDRWVRVAETTHPIPENKRKYDKLYKVYKKLEESYDDSQR